MGRDQRGRPARADAPRAHGLTVGSRERWTSPALVAKEAPPAWFAVWRFRAVAIAFLALFVWLVFQLYQQLSGANDQDPGLDALGALAGVVLRL